MARKLPPEKNRFKKGQSGNPKGRPPKLPKLDELMAEVLGEEKEGIVAAVAILKKLRAQAIGGNVKAAEVLLDRGYGKATAKVTLDGSLDVEINFNDAS